MDEYTIKYKKVFFWKKSKITGHRLDPKLDRMDLFFVDLSMISIPKWSKYTFKLDSEFHKINSKNTPIKKHQM